MGTLVDGWIKYIQVPSFPTVEESNLFVGFFSGKKGKEEIVKPLSLSILYKHLFFSTVISGQSGFAGLKNI